MNTTKIKAVTIATITSIVALYIGITAATAQFEAIAWVLGASFAAICVMLGKHVWILIPATLSLKGGINLLPGMIPPWIFMTMTAGAFFLMRLAIGKQALRIQWSWMETAILIVGITIIQALLRNPVGLRILGGDTAGGKPYFVFAIAIAAYFLITQADTNLKTWRWAVILYIAFGILDGLIQAISAFSPEFAKFMIRIYSNVSFEEAMGYGSGYALDERRMSFLAQIGAMLGLIACSFWRPCAAINITKPWRGIIAGSSIIFILLSGFRSRAAELFMQFCVGSGVRKKYGDIIVVGSIAVLAIATIAISGIAKDLPFGIQRTLTAIPIPIEVDHRARSQAENSSKDRFEMWRIVLKSDRYIQNKILGDGFQFSAIEVNAMAESRIRGSRFQHISFVERSLEVGNYHGFHVETIRFTGAIGLLAATFMLFIFAHSAWRCIKHYRETTAWGYIIFMCMPYMIYPFWYWLIFGSYRAELPQVIALAGMIKLLSMYQTRWIANNQEELTPAP